MVPTVITLSIHLPNKKVIGAGADQDPKDRVDLPSALERYLGRPAGAEFTMLKYSEYYAGYLVEGHSKSSRAALDSCTPPRFAVPRRKPVLCMLNAVSLSRKSSR
jgi:hypothetical protein